MAFEFSQIQKQINNQMCISKVDIHVYSMPVFIGKSLYEVDCVGHSFLTSVTRVYPSFPSEMCIGLEDVFILPQLARGSAATLFYVIM